MSGDAATNRDLSRRYREAFTSFDSGGTLDLTALG